MRQPSKTKNGGEDEPRGYFTSTHVVPRGGSSIESSQSLLRAGIGSKASETSMTLSIENALERLLHARSNRGRVAPLSETHGDLTLEHAYAIQDRLRAELNDGERGIGWKLAATSSTGQAIMGVEEPAGGFLLPVQYASGSEVSCRQGNSPISGWKPKSPSGWARGSSAPASQLPPPCAR